MKFLFTIIFFFLSSSLLADEDSLTKRESDFLKNTPEIRCVTTNTWAPFNIKGDNKEVVGVSIDYWNLISKNIGIKMKDCKVLSSFTEVLNAIKTKQADITLSTAQTKDRLQYAIFSKPYASFPIVIATSDKVDFISNVSELNGKKVAVGKGFTSAILMQNAYKNIDYIEVKNIDAALLLLETGKVYAVVDILPVLVYTISKNGYTNIKISGKTKFVFNLQMMVRKDYPELVSIINHETDEIPKERVNAILKNWFDVMYTKQVDYTILIYIGILFIVIIAFWVYREIVLKKFNKSLANLLKLVEEKNALLEKLSITDKLTGLHNRVKLDEMLESNFDMFLRYENVFSVIILDIDDFKKVNDKFGHLIGDEVLKDFATILRTNIRATDILGRWGGEEFMIISPKTDTVGASKLAHLLKEKLSHHTFEEVGRVTASFGVSQIDATKTIKDVLSDADSALYNAKSLGKNQVVCSL